MEARILSLSVRIGGTSTTEGGWTSLLTYLIRKAPCSAIVLQYYLSFSAYASMCRHRQSILGTNIPTDWTYVGCTCASHTSIYVLIDMKLSACSHGAYIYIYIYIYI